LKRGVGVLLREAKSQKMSKKTQKYTKKGARHREGGSVHTTNWFGEKNGKRRNLRLREMPGRGDRGKAPFLGVFKRCRFGRSHFGGGIQAY